MLIIATLELHPQQQIEGRTLEVIDAERRIAQAYNAGHVRKAASATKVEGKVCIGFLGHKKEELDIILILLRDMSRDGEVMVNFTNDPQVIQTLREEYGIRNPMGVLAKV
jgi:hypothetical protein